VGGHPLGVWLADQRRYYPEGTLEAKRVAELESLGMVWSVHASAWEAGLDLARAYTALHGHCLPAASTVFDGYPPGVSMKNARAAAKKARENAAPRANFDNPELPRGPAFMRRPHRAHPIRTLFDQTSRLIGKRMASEAC